MGYNLALIIEDEEKLLSGDFKATFQLCADSCAKLVNLPENCFASIYIVNDAAIKNLNREHRSIDEATDVLSFPSLELTEADFLKLNKEQKAKEWDIQQNAYFLGDIIVSFETAQHQAKRFGHNLERELCYLLVHGIFHLLGFDHIEKRDKEIMRKNEELALNEVMFKENEKAMIQKAWDMLEFSYVPYSNYRVCACLLTKSGKMYTGNNIENASYGLTICAERTAVFKAVSSGDRDIIAIAIVSDGIAPWPCGACRQVLLEFAEDMHVVIAWGKDKGNREYSTLKELLPKSFSPSLDAEKRFME